VQVWPVQSLASRMGASPAGVTVSRRPSVGSGRMGCGIDSRNRLVAEAELALAPSKAAHRFSSGERTGAPPGAKAGFRMAHTGTQEAHQQPPGPQALDADAFRHALRVEVAAPPAATTGIGDTTSTTCGTSAQMHSADPSDAEVYRCGIEPGQ